MNAACTSYLKICSDVGCPVISELVSALSAGVKSCSISSPSEVLQDGQIIALCAVLPLTNLEDLMFHNLSLNINSWIAIADSCSKAKSLLRLTLKDCTFKDGGQGKATFARALGAAELQTLEITSCMLGDEFTDTLADGKLLRCDKLECLRLVQCGMTCNGAVRLAKALEGVGMMSNLKTLDVSHNRIGDKGGCALAAMLFNEGSSSSVPLQSLELEGNQITDVGGLILCKAAKGALVLSRLNLSLNNLTENTMVAMADALRFNTGTLKEVELAGCRARGDEAAVAVIKAATKNNSLHLLDLRGVPLGPEGVAHLCQLLRYTAVLNTLRVDVAAREGAEIVARELPNNRSLMHLTLGGPVPEQLLAQMSEILAANTMNAASMSPARTSPHIHAWIENATLADNRASFASVLGGGGSSSPHPVSRLAASGSPGGGGGGGGGGGSRGLMGLERSRSPSPGPHRRGARSETAGSVYSHNTYNTSHSHRTAATYLSFQFSQMSRKTGLSTSPGAMRINNSLAAGGAAEKAAVIFRKHDLNQDNYLSRDEMLAALQEVGLLNGIKARQLGRFLEAEFKKADHDRDGKISLQDFISYYEQIAYYQAQTSREGRIKSATYKHQVPVGVENNPALKRVFKNYCKYALGQGRTYSDAVPHMNMQQFHRLAQDAGFVEPEGRLSPISVEVVFYRYRPPGSRRLAFKEFVEALAAVAYEAGMQFEDVMVVLGCRSGGQPLTPDAASARGSDGGLLPLSSTFAAPASNDGSGLGLGLGGGGVGSAYGGHDGGGGSVLASIQEVPTPMGEGGGGAAARAGVPGGAKSAGATPDGKVKKKKKAAVAAGVPGQEPGLGLPVQIQSNSNPLYESVEVMLKQLNSSQVLGNQKALEMRLQMMEQKLAASEQVQRYNDNVRSQDVTSRLLKLENVVQGALSKQDEAEGVSQQMLALQSVLSKLAEETAALKGGHASGGGGAHDFGAGAGAAVSGESGAGLGAKIDMLGSTVAQALTEVRGLAERMDAMQQQLSAVQAEQRHLAKSAGSGAGGSSAGGAAGSEGGALEKKMMDRQARFEGALMQVARQVDLLDARLREEQESSLKALEAVLAQAGLPNTVALSHQPPSGAAANKGLSLEQAGVTVSPTHF